MKNLFLPTTDSAKDLWLKNFAAKLPQYAAKYGISPAEIADIQAGALNVTHFLNVVNQVGEFYHRCTASKNELLTGVAIANATISVPALPTFGTAPTPVTPGVFPRAISIALRIKNHISYVISEGNDLGIESPAVTAMDINTIKPVISVRLIDAGKPEIVWKKNKMSAIQIFVDRGQGYETLAFDTTPNYTDDYPIEPGQAAVWKYKAVYIHDAKQVGQFSDEVKITVSGEHRA